MAEQSSDQEVVAVVAHALERVSRRWREPEEHAEAVLAALDRAGWAVVASHPDAGTLSRI